jgi:indole-3-glycerol phosphate synthase
MKNILDEIIAHKRIELEAVQKRRSLGDLKSRVDEHSSPFDFYEHLKSFSDVNVIAECKAKSPSQGQMVTDYDPVARALQYQRGGAAAISVLTDERFFGGTTEHLREVAAEVNLPVMRKDFIIDEYQIYEARYYGASSYLLIAGVLDTAELQYFIEIGRDLGMEPLVESFSLPDLEIALGTDAKIIGVNNRNLKTMATDITHILQFQELIKIEMPEAIVVCESGIHTRDDIEVMLNHSINTFLIGGSLMVSSDPEKALLDLTRKP